MIISTLTHIAQTAAVLTVGKFDTILIVNWCVAQWLEHSTRSYLGLIPWPSQTERLLKLLYIASLHLTGLPLPLSD